MEEKYIEFRCEVEKIRVMEWELSFCYYRFFPDSNELKVNRYYSTLKESDITSNYLDKLFPDVWETCRSTEDKFIRSSQEFKMATREYKIKKWKKNT